MQNNLKFNIERKSEIENTYRVAKIKGDFDLDIDETSEKFEGEIKLPTNWQIGLIKGRSGTGKSTIAKQLFGDKYFDNFEYEHKSVIDDMPDVPISEIEKTFNMVGFSSIPSWLKPYSVLSNGEKMRVDLARKMMSSDFVVFDEFTSVVDRNIAKIMSFATSKAIRKTEKQFVAISCHNDIIEWLQPDWIFDTNTMSMSFITGDAPKYVSKSASVTMKCGNILASITI